MNRRKFLRNSSLLGSAPLLLNKVSMSTFATSKMLSYFNCDTSDRALVVIFMMGGNDGFNTLVPLNQYNKYANYRPTIKLPQNSLIQLDDTLDDQQKLGLHPSLTALKNLYDNGNAHIVQGVGYPNANKSHFKSTDLWLSGGDGIGQNAGIKSGHFGRFLDAAFPGLVGDPSGSFRDPLGLQLGNSTVSLGYLTDSNEVASANLTDQDPQGLYSVVQDIGTLPHDSTPNSDYGNEIDYIMNVERNTSIYAQRISSVFNAGNNIESYPDNYFANQLKTVARLISGGSKTKIFLLHVYGFDTHDDQIVSGNSTSGKHSQLLNRVFGGVDAFQKDLNKLGIADRVVTTTMSEFGRKVIENGGRGTDHGTLAPMMMFGNPIQSGVTGNNINLDNQDNQGAPSNSQLQYDYRQVFTSFYQDWLGESNSVLNSTFGNIYEKLPIIAPDFVVPPPCYGGSVVPIELLSFTAEKVAENLVRIEWVTALEENHSHYEVERSAQGIRFKGIQTVPGKGIQDAKAVYEVFDNEPLQGVNYYRLKSVDISGEYTYSETVTVTVRSKKIKSILVYPNPAKFSAFIAINSEKATQATIRIFNVSGMEVRNSILNLTRGQQKFSLDIQGLGSGVYTIRLTDAIGDLGSSSLIISE